MTLKSTFSNDIRDVLFGPIMSRRYTAHVTTERKGIVAGSVYAAAKLADIGILPDFLVDEGTSVNPGDLVVSFQGNPKQIALAEERVIGAMAKFSGIASAAWRAAALSQGRCRIASGSWTKMPAEIGESVRDAIVLGGASPRLLDVPFLYLNKNYVRIFGGVAATLDAAAVFKGDRAIVIQLKGETGSIRTEAAEAVRGGADVIMVDTGELADAVEAIQIVAELGVRSSRKVAFGKGVGVEDVPRCVDAGIDLLCMGKAIVDAPLMDMRLDVIQERG